MNPNELKSRRSDPGADICFNTSGHFLSTNETDNVHQIGQGSLKYCAIILQPRIWLNITYQGMKIFEDRRGLRGEDKRGKRIEIEHIDRQ